MAIVPAACAVVFAPWQRPALAVPEHPRQGEQALLARRQQLLAGELGRGVQVERRRAAIGRERLHFEAPPRAQLERQLEAFLDWVASPPPQLDGLLRAGLSHLWFLTLHPYEDGNGRLARAITNRLLAPLGISAQILRGRERYYTALERCQRGDLESQVG